MKRSWIFALVVLGVLAGCHHADDVVYSGADGSRVSVSGNGTHIEATDQNGTKTSETVSDGGVSIKNDKGESLETGAGKVSESDLQLPFYPGSQETGSGSMLMDSPKEKDVVSTRTTPDDADKVIAFYKDKITNPGSTNTSSNGSIMDSLSGKLANGDDATIIVTKEGSKDATIQVSVKHTKAS